MPVVDQEEIPENPEDWERHHIFQLALQKVREERLISADGMRDLSDPISASGGSKPDAGDHVLFEPDSFISYFSRNETVSELIANDSAAWHRIEQLFEGRIYFLPNPH